MFKSIIIVFVVLALSAQAKQWKPTDGEQPTHTPAASSLPQDPNLRPPAPSAQPQITPQVGEEVIINLDLSTVDPSKLTDLEKEILEKVKAGEPIEFSKITQAWVSFYLRKFNKTHHSQMSQEFIQQVLKQLSDASPGTDPNTFKAYYERALEQKLHQAPLTYNKDFHNPIDLLLQNKMQCYSGTVCHSFMARTKWGAEGYLNKNPVIIFEKGHALAGYFNQDNGNLNLSGVETTATALGHRDFGLHKDLGRLVTPVRIVDANIYPVAEIFGAHMTATDKAQLGKQVLAATARRYGLDLAQMEAAIDRQSSNTLPGTGNSSGKGEKADTLLGFGVSDTPEGDITRHQLGDFPPDLETKQYSSIKKEPNIPEEKTVEKGKLPPPIQTPLEKRWYQLLELTPYKYLKAVFQSTPEEVSQMPSKAIIHWLVNTRRHKLAGSYDLAFEPYLGRVEKKEGIGIELRFHSSFEEHPEEIERYLELERALVERFNRLSEAEKAEMFEIYLDR